MGVVPYDIKYIRDNAGVQGGALAYLQRTARPSPPGARLVLHDGEALPVTSGVAVPVLDAGFRRVPGLWGGQDATRILALAVFLPYLGSRNQG